MEQTLKALIPVGGLGTRFLPLSKIFPKEFFPLLDKPLLQHLLEELKASGIQEVVFVVSPQNKKIIPSYFRRDLVLEKFLQEQKKTGILEELKDLEKFGEGFMFSYVEQQKPLGDGNAVLSAQKLIGENPCVVAYPDDVVESRVPCTAQLERIFSTAQQPVLGLYRLPEEKLSAYGVAGCEKIANRLYKIQKIVEKPAPDALPSDLAVVGRRIITSEVFDWLKRARPNKKGEVVLSEVLGEMAKDGKIVYGYEIEGKWLECGDKMQWLRSQTYLTLRHPEYGKDIQKFLKEERVM